MTGEVEGIEIEFVDDKIGLGFSAGMEGDPLEGVKGVGGGGGATCWTV